jgi:hypothetical protein
MDKIYEYPKVFAMGHRAIRDILTGSVVIEEKVDGSQFSFGVIDGELVCRSKRQKLELEAPEQLFIQAVEAARELAPLLHPGWIYRGEYLKKPKHNVLAYDRVPRRHIIIFDVVTDHETYLMPWEKAAEAERLGLEVTPVIYAGKAPESPDALKGLLGTLSVLGGQTIEGVVVKNYDRLTPFGFVMMGKYVSENFKEVAGVVWKKNNPRPDDFIEQLVSRYRTPARWQKAVQHLTDAGKLEDSPRDIGILLKEVAQDVLEEEGDAIKETIFKHFWKDIHRGLVKGIPEWYKERLLERAFDGGDDVIA